MRNLAVHHVSFFFQSVDIRFEISLWAISMNVGKPNVLPYPTLARMEGCAVKKYELPYRSFFERHTGVKRPPVWLHCVTHGYIRSSHCGGSSLWLPVPLSW